MARPSEQRRSVGKKKCDGKKYKNQPAAEGGVRPRQNSSLSRSIADANAMLLECGKYREIGNEKLKMSAQGATRSYKRISLLLTYLELWWQFAVSESAFTDL